MSGKLEGKVIAISNEGNLITDIAAESLDGAPRDERIAVTCDEHQTSGLFAADHDQPEMTLIALIGERNLLELCIVGDSASIMLGVGTGAPVKVEWA